MRYHFMLVRMAAIKKSTNNKCWRGCGEKGTSYTVGWNVNQYSHYGEQCEDSFKKLEIQLPYDPAILPLGIHTKETRIERAMFTTQHCLQQLFIMFITVYSVHHSTVYNSYDMEATQMSISRLMDKKVVHLHNGILLSYLKKCI